MSPDIQSHPNHRLQRKKSAAQLNLPKNLKMVAEQEASLINNNNNGPAKVAVNSTKSVPNSGSKTKALRQRSLKKLSNENQPTSYHLACKGHAKSTRLRRIQGSNGFYLEVLCEGSIRATRNAKSQYGVFHLFSVGPNKTVIRNIMTGLHVGIENGHLLAKEIPDQSCLLDEVLLDRFLIAFQSSDTKDKTYSVAIDDTGSVSAIPMNERKKNSTMLFKTPLLSPKDFDYFFSLANSLEYSM